MLSEVVGTDLRGSRSRLDVVAAQELLEVQDRELVALGQGEELAERRIGVDRLLVHQAVALGVIHDALGHGRAADLGVLGLAEEGAQLLRDADGLGEDTVLGSGTLDGLGLSLAAAIGLLGEAGGQLLNGLEVGGLLGGIGLGKRHQLVLLGDRVRERHGDVLLDGGGRLERRRGGGRCQCRGRSRGWGWGRGWRSNRSSSGLLADLGRRNSRNRRDNSSNDNSGRLNGLHGGLLGGGGLSGGSAHFGVLGGSI